MRADLRWFFAGFLAVLVCAWPAGAAPRVASLNLCTDQLLLQVAEPEQVVSLSFLAADPVSSALWREAGDFASNRGTAEEVLAMDDVDVVLVGAYSTAHTTRILKTLGYRVEAFAPANSLAATRENITRMGEIVGQPARAAQLVADINAEVEAARRAVPDGPRPVFATYAVNGWTSGDGSLIAELAEIAGFTTLSRKLGGMRQVSMEALIVAAPDLIDISSDYQDPPARATNALRHPALARLLERTDTIEIPGNLTACGTSAITKPLAMLGAKRAEMTAR